MTKSTKEDFNLAVQVLCGEMQGAGFHCARIVRMLAINVGGVLAVKHLLNAPKLSSGFTDLFISGCSHLTVEKLALQHQHHFTEAEIQIATNRLRVSSPNKFGYAS